MPTRTSGSCFAGRSGSGGRRIVAVPVLRAFADGSIETMFETHVRDILVPLEQYPCIPDTLTLRDAITEMAVQILKRKQLSLPRVALVFDDDFNELLGMLRRRDIMRGIEPRFLAGGSLDYRRKLFNVAMDANLSELAYDKIIEHIRKRSNRLVGEFMIPIKATINYEDHITKAVYEMVEQNTSLLPVLKDRHVVGVVRSVDVLSEISLLIGP